MFIISFVVCVYIFIFFFKQKTAYEMRISDWSSDVCSSDLLSLCHPVFYLELLRIGGGLNRVRNLVAEIVLDPSRREWRVCVRSEEHTSELQSLMRTSYAVFCLKKKKTTVTILDNTDTLNVQHVKSPTRNRTKHTSR